MRCQRSTSRSASCLNTPENLLLHNMATCIFPGRFQPFHDGHLLVIQGMMKVHGNATIVICDGKGGHGADTPFTMQQRREMISSALLAVDIMDANIVEVVDKGDDGEWANAVLDAAGNPGEPMVWSGDEKVREIFEAKGVATKKIVPVPGIDGAAIQKKIMAKDSSWREKVPAGAVDVITEILAKRSA